eukprot:m.217293 g.217293  ORF g.217293 m.217293 type:complete len:287 (-) comp19121_c0_seq1:218-1078(-)
MSTPKWMLQTGSTRLPNFIYYWTVLATILGSAWLFHPFTVSSTYVVSCMLHSIWGNFIGSARLFQKQKDERPGDRHLFSGWGRRRSIATALSLCNCIMCDLLITYFVRQRPDLLYAVEEMSLGACIYIYFSPVPLLAIHDAWFYATHRVLHANKLLFRWVHALHHERSAPEAWDLFYMHPVEAAVTVLLPFLVVPRVLPCHWLLWECWVVKAVMIDCYGHCGFDAHPFHPFKLTPFSWLPRLPWKRIFLNAKHHDDHHRVMHGNYALYFNLWDNLCGTSVSVKTPA